MKKDIQERISTCDFSRTEIVVCQNHFADPIWDPEEKYLSTNRAYLDGKREGFDFVDQQLIGFYTGKGGLC